MRRPGPLQALRGLIAGLLTTFLALAFHVGGGGTSPEPLGVALCAAAVCWVAMLIGRARASLLLLATSIAVAQVVLHTAFSLATASATISNHSHASHDVVSLVVTGSGHAMWPGHVLAGVVTVIMVRRGEQVLRRLLELARMSAGALMQRLVVALVVDARPLVRRAIATRSLVPAFAVDRTLGSLVPTRGPPALGA